MKNKLGPDSERLWKQAVRDIPKFLAGKPSSYRKISLPLPASEKEVKKARRAAHATQKSFAMIVGVSVETVRAWESGRRIPEGPASKLIRLIIKDPDFVEILDAA